MEMCGDREFLVVVEQAEDGGFSAHVPDLSACVACGDSPAEVAASIREAIASHIESVEQHGEPVPSPSARGISVGG
jgi:predicted RNase H-like HicB family nuclease